jgi:DNA-directed RNA polymerase subunit RPC12/RpoP
MPTLNHVHTYHRIDKKTGEWGCKDPYCSCVTEKKYILGKASRCNNCGNEFKLTSYDLRLKEPRCVECSERRAAKEFRQKTEVIGSLFGEKEVKKETDASSN